jgi:hypothetical protein
VARPVSSRAASSVASRSNNRRDPQRDRLAVVSPPETASSSSKSAIASPAPFALSFGAAAASFAARRAISAATRQASAAACDRATQTALESFPSRLDPAAAVGAAEGLRLYLADQQRNRRWPTQLAGQDQIGEPKGEQFGVGPNGEDVAEDRRRRERRRRRSERVDPGGRRGQLSAPGNPQQLRDGAQAFFGQIGRSLGEPPPGGENAAGRAGIAARRTQMPGVAQRRLVLAAAEPADGGGGAFQGEALTPGPQSTAARPGRDCPKNSMPRLREKPLPARRRCLPPRGRTAPRPGARGVSAAILRAAESARIMRGILAERGAFAYGSLAKPPRP